jgi:hypothetical protein
MIYSVVLIIFPFDKEKNIENFITKKLKNAKTIDF